MTSGGPLVPSKSRRVAGIVETRPNYMSRGCPKPVTCRSCGRIQRDCRQPQRLSPDKKGKGRGQGKARSVEEGGELEEEATGEATANETSETFMMVRSGSGTLSGLLLLERSRAFAGPPMGVGSFCLLGHCQCLERPRAVTLPWCAVLDTCWSPVQGTGHFPRHYKHWLPIVGWEAKWFWR